MTTQQARQCEIWSRALLKMCDSSKILAAAGASSRVGVPRFYRNLTGFSDVLCSPDPWWNLPGRDCCTYPSSHPMGRRIYR